jgi:hypothetical protein
MIVPFQPSNGTSDMACRVVEVRVHRHVGLAGVFYNVGHVMRRRKCRTSWFALRTEADGRAIGMRLDTVHPELRSRFVEVARSVDLVHYSDVMRSS